MPSSSCRVELGADAAPAALLSALGVLAACALAFSAVPLPVAALLWTAAVAIVLWRWWRRWQVATLTVTTPDQVLLGLRDGNEVVAMLRGSRVLGPLLLLDLLPDAGSARPLLIWQPALQMNAARRLRRTLAAMRSVGDGSV